MTPIMRLLTLTRTFLYAVPRVADVCSYRDARVSRTIRVQERPSHQRPTL